MKLTLTYHHFPKIEKDAHVYMWEQDSIPFDELIISWNALRPQHGIFKIGVAVRINDVWSPSFPYAEWGCAGQQGGDIHDSSFSLRIKEDLLELGTKATGFRVYVEGASLDEFYSIHACASNRSEIFLEQSDGPDSSIDLPVPLISQMQLKHHHHMNMCSAASTTSVISYLLNINRFDAVSFALQAHDDAFGIFGNWILNTAQASAVLGKKWSCWVQRLNGFDDIYNQLQAQLPVVVSIRGPLPGSALPYHQGHLVVVKGYSHKDKRVLCMDPAFPEDEKTAVSYDLQDFLEAWSRRQNIAYIFKVTRPSRPA